MTWRDYAITAFLIAVGCSQMLGDVLSVPALKGFGAATTASPAPKVFTAQDGFETYANRFFLEWRDDAGGQRALELTPENYAGVRGPYNRRNVYGAIFSYAPVLDANPLTRPMFRAVLANSFCSTSPIFTEVGVPSEATRHGVLRIRLEPRRASDAQRFVLTHEVSCNG